MLAIILALIAGGIVLAQLTQGKLPATWEYIFGLIILAVLSIINISIYRNPAILLMKKIYRKLIGLELRFGVEKKKE